MPNKSYQKGYRLERQLVNEARKQGLIAARTAGSHSPFDVVIIDPNNHTIRFIQAKAKKLSQNALERLRQRLDLGQWDGEYLVKFELITK